MMSPGLNLVMTVIGFAVSTMFIIFVCTRLICARIHLRNSRIAFATASGSDLSLIERGLHGLEPAVAASFPTKKFGEFSQSGRDLHTADNHELRSIQTDRVGGEQPLSSGENETGGKHAESPSYS